MQHPACCLLCLALRVRVFVFINVFLCVVFVPSRALKSDKPLQWQRSLVALQSKVKAKLPEHAPLMLGENNGSNLGHKSCGLDRWSLGSRTSDDHLASFLRARCT